MKWLELSAAVDAETVDMVAELLGGVAYGGVAIEEELSPVPLIEGENPLPFPRQFKVKAYLPVNSSLPGRKRRLRQSLNHLSLLCPVRLEERVISEEDWENSWKVHFHAHRVGARIVIKPPWEDYSPSPGEVVLQLAPGMAFGTGLHPTTRRCLLELEKRIYPGGEVLDLGTGTGILAIAAAKLGARRVVALDIDPVAVKVAKQNIRLNQVQRKVMVKRGTLMPDAPERFDLIAANIVAAVLEKLAESMASSLKPQSAIIAGGIIAERLEGVVSRFAQAGLKVVKVLRDGEWRTVVAESPRY